MKYKITKNLILRILLLLTVSHSAVSQICPTSDDNIILNTQQEVDDFVTTYSGTCNEIVGNLTIGPTSGTSDITSVSGFSFIEEINESTFIRDGKLTIQNTQLTTLTGFENLEQVTEILVQNNPILQQISGFSSLSYFALELNIINNPVLSAITDLGLQTNFGSIQLVDNILLTDLNGFKNITEIGYNGAGTFGLKILGNASLEKLSLLNKIERVHQDVLIENNNNLTNADLSGLKRLDGDFSVIDNPSLMMLGSMPALEMIGGEFEIRNCPISAILLPSIEPNTGINHLTLHSIPLPDLGGFTDIVEMSGTLRLAELDNLSSTSKLTSLATLGELRIQGCDVLTDIVMNQLSSLGGISFTHNASLEEIPPFGSFNAAGEITISSNPLLTSIDFFDQLIQITDQVRVVNNSTLDNCCILRKLMNGEILFDTNLIDIFGNDDNCDELSDVFNCNEDGIPKPIDNCPDIDNPTQSDTDGDGVGDVCDNCPTVTNASQVDTDGNGIGDDCETQAGENTGEVGIGTVAPQSKLQITDGDVYIDNPARGIIMKTASGKCFRVKPNDKGELVATEIKCP